MNDDMFPEMSEVVGRDSIPERCRDVTRCDSPGHVALNGQPDLWLLFPIQRSEDLEKVVLDGGQRFWKKQQILTSSKKNEKMLKKTFQKFLREADFKKFSLRLYFFFYLILNIYF